MFKRTWFLSLLVFAVVGNAAATGAYSDTTDTRKKDSVAVPASSNDTDLALNDPKAGFHDLFVKSATTNGVSIEQLNPLAISFVQDYMGKFAASMSLMKDWGRPYFDMMDAILVQHGLPKELKYLAVIESQLKSQARSWAGAVGPWQLMPATAKTLGLKINKKVDERRDLYKSTQAACKYLTDLYAIYGDWLLVIAAYNGGPGKVNSAIKRSGSVDFWILQNFLPLESRNHVKKFIATHYLMEGEGGVTTLTKKEVGDLLTASVAQVAVSDTDGDMSRQAISGRYNAAILARSIAMDLPSFYKLNPNFDKAIGETGEFDLRLPNDKMEIFRSKKMDILSESMQFLLNPTGTEAAATGSR